MRLVTWNCCKRLRGAKLDALFALRPDVAVVQECDQATIEGLRERGMQTHWIGDNPTHGLGVISWLDEPFEPDLCYDEGIRWFMPVRIGPINLVAVWAFHHRDGLSKESNILTATARYRDFLTGGNAIFVGDLNDNIIWDKKTKPGFAQAIESLAGLGLHSVYHAHSGEAAGQETLATHYFRWKREQPYHIDYCFAPESWISRLTSVTVGRHDDWIALSDHSPVVVDFRVPGSTDLGETGAVFWSERNEFVP